MKKVDKWDGEARGCADVIFSRIQILLRKNNTKREYSNLYESVISLVTYCEDNGVRLTDILEEVYLVLKEDSNSESSSQ